MSAMHEYVGCIRGSGIASSAADLIYRDECGARNVRSWWSV